MSEIKIPKNKKLGQLCKRGHDYMGTGKSLRTISSSSCCECLKLSGSNDKLIKQLAHYDHKHPRLKEWRKNLVDLDTAEIKAAIKEAKAKQRRKTFWGKPCRNGHVDPATGLTERYLAAGRGCVQCSKERHRRKQAEIQAPPKPGQEPKPKPTGPGKFDFSTPLDINSIRKKYADFAKQARQWEIEDRLARRKKAG